MARMLLLQALLAAASAVHPYAPANGQTDFWQPTNGPYGGNVAGVVTDVVGDLAAIETDGIVFRSTDEGEHWMKVSRVPSYEVHVLLRAPNGRFFAGTMDGVFRSTDGGNSWEQINAGLTRTEIYDLGCDQNGTLYTGSYFGGVSRSTDHGDTWVPLGLLYVESLFVTPAGDVFAGTSNAIYKYSTAGWNQLGLSNVSVNAIMLNPSGHIFAATYYSSGRVLLSTDQGAHWVQSSSGMPQYASVFSLFINSSGYLFAGVYEMNNNLTRMFVSTNNGASWLPLSLSPRGVLTQTTTGRMYFGGNGVYCSTNAGMDWAQTRYTALAVSNVAVTSTQTVAAVTPQGVFRSLNSGGTWEALNLHYRGLLAANGTGDLFSASFTVHRSTDNGTTWNPANTGWESVWATAMSISPGGTIFASTTRSIDPCPCTIGLFRSTDNGVTWPRINPDSLAFLRAIGIHPLGDDLYVSSSNTVYRSTNLGDSWNTVLPGIPAITAIAVASDGTVLVAADSGHVYRSSDHGDTWSQHGVTTSPIHCIVLARNQHVLAAADSGVFRSTNGGLSWEPMMVGLATPQVLSLAVDSVGYVYAGTGGLGVFRTNAPITSRIDAGSSGMQSFELEQNYPNPFNPVTSIKFKVESSKLVTLRVYDVLGREVVTLVNEKKEPGTYEVTWDASDRPSGVYFCRMSAANFHQTRKLLLIR